MPLAFYPSLCSLWTAWIQWWNTWAELAQRWLHMASNHENGCALGCLSLTHRWRPSCRKTCTSSV